MAFEQLTQRLSEQFKKLTKQDRLNEKHLDSLLSEVRLSLLEADVYVSVVEDFIRSIRNQALGQKILGQLKPNEALMKIIYDMLVELLGTSNTSFDYPNQFVSIMMVGLQGTGKTTSVIKLADLLSKKQRKVLIIAADLSRPAAINQLEILALGIKIQVYSDKNSKDTLKVIADGLAFAKSNALDTVIIDTAGRLHIDETLMEELVKIKALAKPKDILLTVDALTGQDIFNVTKRFHERLQLSGLVVTKFDGDSKGGAVLSARATTKVPVLLVTTGEKVQDYDIFYPDRMANRIIGMGDLLSLVEQAETKIDKQVQTDAANRLMSGQFTFDDMLIQIDQLSKMGSLKSLIGMLPGASQMAAQVNDAQSAAAMKKSKAIIESMTKAERQDASLLRASRKNRIAKGCGASVTEVNRLISQYEKAKEQMRLLARMGKSKGAF
ncbi:MAG: signal recognition particle protein [Erysipelotrichaceae bacterium]